jgi:hypothetical protein
MEVGIVVQDGLLKREMCGGWRTLKPVETSCVAFDKSEGVVKRHFFAAMLSSTAGYSGHHAPKLPWLG